MGVFKSFTNGFKEGWNMTVSEKDIKQMKTMANKISDNMNLGVHFDVNKTKEQKISSIGALRPAGEEDGFRFKF